MVKVLSKVGEKHQEIYARFREDMEDGSNKSAAVAEVAEHFGITTRQVYNIVAKKEGGNKCK
jgi:hypothetical protein